MLDRVLNKFLEIALDLLETTNILPRNVRDFDHRLTQTRRIRLRQCMSKMILTDGHTVQYFRINLFIFDIDQIHLFTNALHGSFGTECGDIGPNKAVRFPRNRLRFHIFVQFHVSRMNAEDFQTTILIRHADINFAIETPETAQGWVNGVGAVGCPNDNNTGALFEAVHERQHLTDDTTLDFAIGFFTLGRNGVNLVDKDNGRSILFCFLKSLAQVRFGFTSHLGHDFGPVDQKEKSSGFVGNSPSNESLSGAGRTVQQDTARWLDTQCLE
mmetsp:Transcript_44912/g.118629  ORF Transcript_44912/g.118629 Transcript_44912/m.118629 type:complete len:271 (-) Transcript_44912:13-825(-)